MLISAIYSGVQLVTMLVSAFTVGTVVYSAVQCHLQWRTVGYMLVSVFTVGYSALQCWSVSLQWVQLVTMLVVAWLVAYSGCQ